MHTDQPYFPQKPILPLGEQMSYYMQNPPTASVLNGFVPPGIKRPLPFHNVDVKPSIACPRNFIIFDQTNNKSQIMFHPEISSKLFYHPSFGVGTSLFQDDVVLKDENDEKRVVASPLEEEDYDDIDALLSSEYEENEEVEDDEVSTARTGAYYECGSPDSCSNYETAPKKRRTLYMKSSGIRGNEKKHKRMRKMVKALRGIVPGANRMTTVAVLDESVRYLKSLRVEVQKLGVKNFTG